MNKSIIFKSLALLIVLISSGISAKAQWENLEQSVFLNFNCPTAQFNDKLTGFVSPMLKQEMGKGAMVGFGAGYRISYHFDIGFGEVTPYVQADLQWNALKGDYRDVYTQAKCSAPNYFNIPVYFGVNYRYQLNDIFTPFAEFGLGADVLLMTGETALSDKVKIRYKGTTEFAWQIGIGSYFTEHVSASIHYQGYGKHVMDYTSSTVKRLNDNGISNSTDIDEVVQRTVGMFSLRIGFHF